MQSRRELKPALGIPLERLRLVKRAISSSGSMIGLVSIEEFRLLYKAERRLDSARSTNAGPHSTSGIRSRSKSVSRYRDLRRNRQENRFICSANVFATRLQIKRPGIAEFDSGILWPKVIKNFRNLDFRMRAARRKHRRGHGNVGRALLTSCSTDSSKVGAQNSL